MNSFIIILKVLNKNEPYIIVRTAHKIDWFKFPGDTVNIWRDLAVGIYVTDG